MEKAKDVKKTCQVCGRLIKAGSGLIAHHGYKRPGDGWQTASCQGAKYLPYEESCNRLREVTANWTQYLARLQASYEKFMSEPPQEITVTERDRKTCRNVENTYQKPENFDTRHYIASPWTYANAFAQRKSDYVIELRALTAALKSMNERIIAWKPAK